MEVRLFVKTFLRSSYRHSASNTFPATGGLGGRTDVPSSDQKRAITHSSTSATLSVER